MGTLRLPLKKKSARDGLSSKYLFIRTLLFIAIVDISVRDREERVVFATLCTYLNLQLRSSLLQGVQCMKLVLTLGFAVVWA